MLNTLSGRFLVLTAAFVMLAEVLIFVPSVARFRVDYLTSRLERAQIAALSVIAGDDMVSADLEEELLRTAGVYNVVLRRDDTRQLVLSSSLPEPVQATYDLRQTAPPTLIRDAFTALAGRNQSVIRVIGQPVGGAGLLIEVTLPGGPLQVAMIDYGLRILALSAAIAVVTAVLLFLAVRRVLVQPIRGVVDNMARYARAPEDARSVIRPTAGIRELREAEEALASLQTEITGALRQKERLAQLGSAVAKVSHDLRNILTTASLFADRLESSKDPAIRRAAPKLVGAIERAVNLCEGTLAFGRAEEPAPRLQRFALAPVVADIVDGERLAAGERDVSFREDIPAGLSIVADREQLSRILLNIVRNARQAIEASGRGGEIGVSAGEDLERWIICVSDTGPGLPRAAQENLFAAFKGGIRKGGTGLGLAIASELVRGHGGSLRLEKTGEAGTSFTIQFPKAQVLEAAAE